MSSNIVSCQGVVRKTVSDDLVENIWEPVHMDKIVPSLLYNMQYSRSGHFSNFYFYKNHSLNYCFFFLYGCLRE